MRKYTKEIVLILITALVVSVVSVSATVYFNSENIVFEPEATNWNVSNTSSALNDLYNTSNTKITNFKTTIAQAITEMGVTTEEDADVETMANNIKNISFLGSSFDNLKSTNIVFEQNYNGGTSSYSYLMNDKSNGILIVAASRDASSSQPVISVNSTGTIKEMFRYASSPNSRWDIPSIVECAYLITDSKNATISISITNSNARIVNLITN